MVQKVVLERLKAKAIFIKIIINNVAFLKNILPERFGMHRVQYSVIQAQMFNEFYSDIDEALGFLKNVKEDLIRQSGLPDWIATCKEEMFFLNDLLTKYFEPEDLVVKQAQRIFSLLHANELDDLEELIAGLYQKLEEMSESGQPLNPKRGESLVQK